MRGRSHLLAALAAAGIVALCLVTIGGAVASAVPRGEGGLRDDARVPSDLVWTWVSICQMTVVGEAVSSIGYATTSVDSDGVVTAEFGTIDEKGATRSDEERSAAINDCLATRRAEGGGLSFGSVSYGHPSDAQGLELYDWAVRYQRPCLAARGIETTVPPIEQFIDEQYLPWYLLDQYIWSGSRGPADLDFDMLLEARLACPPSPSFLVGVATW